ncbi:MAG: putative porin [Candidatus Rokubacteria bacterium]|nr:putative porin [Candidatus Rokubacteria bacterium]
MSGAKETRRPHPTSRSRGTISAIAVAALLGGFAASPAAAQADSEKPSKPKFFGDVRLRAESDWDSLQSDGTLRADRHRLRLRLRLGFSYAYDDHLSFGGRLRTSSPLDQQSPHQTLGDELETKGVNIDKAFIHGTWARGWAWIGTNGFPFWP